MIAYDDNAIMIPVTTSNSRSDVPRCRRLKFTFIHYSLELCHRLILRAHELHAVSQLLRSYKWFVLFDLRGGVRPATGPHASRGYKKLQVALRSSFTAPASPSP